MKKKIKIRDAVSHCLDKILSCYACPEQSEEVIIRICC